MDYGIVKLVHVSAVAISLGGFFARGVGMMQNAAWIGTRAAKTLPHIVDTILLASALMLAWQLRLSPASAPWLAAKIIGLVVYIVLGAIALRRGRSKEARVAAWTAALLTFGYIVSVALTKDPRGPLALVH
jgi:uncharacterized membrane protein SirB2